MKEVHISFLQNLDNLEFKVFYSAFLEMMQYRNLVDPTLASLQSRLEGHEKDVNALKSRMEVYEDTEKINELTRLCTDYLISFRLGIKSKMLWCDAEKRLAGERLYTWLKKYKKEPFIQTIETQYTAVCDILESMNESESLQADIALLGLKELVVAIDEITQQINLHVKKRKNEKKSRNQKGRVNRDAAYKDLRILADHLASKISLIRLMEGDVEESVYYILLGDLDFQLKDIRTVFRIRTAKDKTRREKKALQKLKAAKDAEVKQLKASKEKEGEQLKVVMQAEVNHPEIVEQSQETMQPDTHEKSQQLIQPETLVQDHQAEALNKVLSEPIKKPSTKGQLTDMPLENSAHTTPKRDLN